MISVRPFAVLACATLALSQAGWSAGKEAGLPGSKPKAASKTVVKPKPNTTRPKPAAKPTPRPVATPAPTPTPTPTPTPEPTKTWALLVGVGKYKNPAISPLKYPAADAQGIHKALTDPTLGNLPAEQVRMLTDEKATTAAILGEVDTFLKPNVKSGDKVLVFLAGHGIAKGVGLSAKSYFLTHDTAGVTVAALDKTSVGLKNLTEKLSELPAAQFVTFVDACRENPTPGRGSQVNAMNNIVERDLQMTPADTRDKPAPSSITFFACGIGQRAFERPDKEHGAFTFAILDAIGQGAVAEQNGTIDLSRLASYVRNNVSTWSKKYAAETQSDFEQTPEAVVQISDTAAAQSDDVVLLRVNRPVTAQPIAATAPVLEVDSSPEGAQVSVNGERKGAAPLSISLPQGGVYQVKIEAPGYETVERSVRVVAGLERPLWVQLKPAARSVSEPASAQTENFFKRAIEAEEQQKWEEALGAYSLALDADAKSAPAYERLAALQTKRGLTRDAVGTLVKMVAQVPSAHAYALLALSSAKYAIREKQLAAAQPQEEKKGGGLFGKKKKPAAPPVATTGFAMPQNGPDAAALSRRAADQAVKMEPTSPESQLALGFALIASDDEKSTNENAALTALGKAMFLDNKDATNYYGLGYGIRNYAVLKKPQARDAELKRAVEMQTKALQQRPDFFEARMERAFCYHLLNDTKAAFGEYQLANSYRGSASSEDEVAGINLAMAGLCKQMANGMSGPKKANWLAASQGWEIDAKETAPNGDLTGAASFLNGVGMRSILTQVGMNMLFNGIGDKIGGGLIGGLGGIF